MAKETREDAIRYRDPHRERRDATLSTALTRAVSDTLWFGSLCESCPAWSAVFAILQYINTLPLKIDISLKALSVQAFARVQFVRCG